MRPNPTRTPPDISVQTKAGTVINTVEALRINVNRMIDPAKDATTIYGVKRLRPVADAPITTGNNGKMHGANTVSMPDRNDTRSRVTVQLFYLSDDISQRW